MSEAPEFDVNATLASADALAKIIHRLTEDREWPGLNALQDAVERYEGDRHPNQGQSCPCPFTGIDEQIARAGWVLRRLVAVLGFQAELRVFGGDYMEHGTTVNRGVRISVKRRSFNGEHLRELTLFAEDHGCDLEISQEHGATLHLRPIVEAETQTHGSEKPTVGGGEGSTSSSITFGGVTFAGSD